MMRRIRQWFCGLAGHEEMFRFTHRCLKAECLRCGHLSAGWEIGK